MSLLERINAEKAKRGVPPYRSIDEIFLVAKHHGVSIEDTHRWLREFDKRRAGHEAL